MKSAYEIREIARTHRVKQLDRVHLPKHPLVRKVISRGKKGARVAASLCLCLLLVSCASFEMSAGIGYRKVPPEVSEPILPRALAAGIPPIYIDLILKLLASPGFQDIIKHLAPADNRVDLGLWLEMRSREER